ncbi:hypothetical protein HPB48_017960 [Haemaphysalis longicornis]|uniref:Uncharacterized protein n=1 Tax=Haemaphysalis longicornis TaxID=44386 RepID=A0A9J6FRS2_HAELO|nr:hypothetical protein HPB48_017960 [Haemaphysalis longicornis]
MAVKASWMHTDIRLRAYLAAPTDSCRGVIHGVEANTPPEELAANLISTGASIISARMMGRTETALITLAGSTITRYVIYHHTDFSHRVDVCPLPPSTVLCPTCSRDITGLAADQEHDCVPRCCLCRGAHASTSPKCPTRMDADAQSARRAYKPRIVKTGVTDPRPENDNAPNSDIDNGPVPAATRLPVPPPQPVPSSHRRVTSSQHVRVRLPGDTQAQQGEVSQQPSVGAPTSPAHPPATTTTSSLTYRNALAPPGSSTSPTLPLPLTAPHTFPELYALMVNLFSHFDRRLATIEEALDHRPRRKRAPPSKNSPSPRTPKINFMLQGRFCLRNDPAFPTRLGNSVERDASPDMSFSQGTGNPSWSHLHESLGSDHSIIEIRLPFMRAQPRPGSRVALTGWHRFRLSDLPTIDPTNPGAWLRAITRNHDRHAKYVAPTADAPFIDPHLSCTLLTRATHSFAAGAGTKPAVACAVE